MKYIIILFGAANMFIFFMPVYKKNTIGYYKKRYNSSCSNPGCQS